MEEKIRTDLQGFLDEQRSRKQVCMLLRAVEAQAEEKRGVLRY